MVMGDKALTLQQIRNISQRDRELARKRIKIGETITRLQTAVLDDEQQMSPTQVKAAALLLQVAGMITQKVETETTVKHEHSITAETIKLLRMANTKIIEMDDSNHNDSKHSLTIEHQPVINNPIPDDAPIPEPLPVIVSTHSHNDEEDDDDPSKW